MLSDDPKTAKQQLIVFVVAILCLIVSASLVGVGWWTPLFVFPPVVGLLAHFTIQERKAGEVEAREGR